MMKTNCELAEEEKVVVEENLKVNYLIVDPQTYCCALSTLT